MTSLEHDRGSKPSRGISVLSKESGGMKRSSPNCGLYRKGRYIWKEIRVLVRPKSFLKAYLPTNTKGLGVVAL